MRFENTKVMNFEGALRGMRNPIHSGGKSDSGICKGGDTGIGCEHCAEQTKCKHTYNHAFKIGKNDMKLAQQLIIAGSEHRKFMRQILVSVDITAPLFWWEEFDRYKTGVTTNGCPTIHILATTPINTDCFECEDMEGFYGNVKQEDNKVEISEFERFKEIVSYCEDLRMKYLDTKDKKYWRTLIETLPESWLQTRTVTMSYENLLAMCGKGQRRFHKLYEWSGQDDNEKPDFISWARTLPYAQELIFIDEVEA